MYVKTQLEFVLLEVWSGLIWTLNNNSIACLSDWFFKIKQMSNRKATVTMQNIWNNRISDGWVYAQMRKRLGMHLVTYSNHDTVTFLLIVPIKGRFVWDGIHCVFI